MMTVDPDLVEFDEPDPESGLSQIYYAGLPVGGCFVSCRPPPVSARLATTLPQL